MRTSPYDPHRPILLPFPDGWFGVAFSSELKPGQVLRRRLAGEDVVLYRTRGGRLRGIEPYCPHLGAHLGVGGRVENEDLVCPFHGFAFDPSGACVRTGYGTAPPARARLVQRHIHEASGMIWVWRHAEGAPPSWNFPEGPGEEHSTYPCSSFHLLRTYPQEMLENIVDLGHFGPLHGYSGVRIGDVPPVFDGDTFRAHFIAERAFPLLGVLTVDLRFRVYGLGCVHFAVEIPRVGVRMLVVAGFTPRNPGETEMRMAAYYQKPGLKVVSSPRVRAALQSVVESTSRVLLPQVFRWFEREIRQDQPIFETKTYLERARPAQGDGPIMPYRRWASQFYTPPLRSAAAEGPFRHRLDADEA
ncbi:(2Fe-2S)-binding protein [Streptosporangium nondiastaticum]|uniref:cholesterol 7-desaturase n=1 Tax=Streptosporangium nondiastaticum TaxID=35764 RepID=A0A9X7JV04_9ACTN|nr:Rieske 2Fe-2S domain-containing protein [Streptosporangium nondiastaticum]PSJ30438.1 (2Fe-2S)-binding protein [Streptosporangium nondiastaticum]